MSLAFDKQDKEACLFPKKGIRGAEVSYHKIKRISLLVVVTSKLRPYFQGHKTFCKN